MPSRARRRSACRSRETQAAECKGAADLVGQIPHKWVRSLARTLTRAGALGAWIHLKDTRVASLVLVRQRPVLEKGVLFITIEDGTRSQT